MKCDKCGAEISSDTKFCNSCGSEIKVTETVNAATANPIVKPIEPSEPKVKKENMFQKGIKDKRVRIGALILVILIAIIVGVMAFLNKSSQQIFNKSIDQLFKSVENKVDSSSAKKVSGKTNMKLEVTGLGEVTEMFNKLAVDFNYELDYDKKIMNMQMKPTYDKNMMFDLNAHFVNDEGYMYLNEVFNKYIKIPFTKEQANEMFSTEGSENNKIMLVELKKEFKKSLSSKYFTKEKAEIKVDGEYVKVTKSTLTLNDKNLQEFMKVFATNLKENDKFIEVFSKMSDTSKADIKQQLSDSINDNDYENSDQTLKISIYTEGLFNNFKGVVFGMTSGTQKSSIDVLKVDNNNYEYKLQNDGATLAKGTVKVEDKDDNQIVTIEVNVAIVNVKLILNNKIDKDAKIEAKKIKDFVESDELTEEEQNQIVSKIMATKGMNKFLNEFNKLMNGSAGLGY